MFHGARQAIVAALGGVLCFGASSGQAPADAGARTPSRQQKTAVPGKQKAGPEADAAKQLLKDQAVQLLRSVVAFSRSMESPGQRSTLVADASGLLWGYDEQAARAGLYEAFEDFLQKYKDADAKPPTEKALARGRLDAAVKVLLKALARKDPAASESAMKRYQGIRAESQKNTASDPAYRERLTLAQESLDSDLKQSVALASGLLEVGVPADFAQYLYDLRRRDADAADALYGKALTVLSRGQAYGAPDAINLSVYAFGENMVLIPVPDISAESKRLVFGISTRRLSTADTRADAALPRAYMAAAHAYLAAQLQPQSARGSSEIYLGQSLFLLRKLGVYASRLGLDREGEWQQLEAITESRCRNLGMEEEVISYLKGYGGRLAAQDDVFQMREASSLKEAKETRDETLRKQLLLRGAWNLIQGQQFQEAELWIKEIEDGSTRQQLANVLHYYAGKHAVESSDWNEAERRAELIEDLRVRSLFLLAAARARASRGAAERSQADLYLQQARSHSAKIAEKKSRAGILVALASFSTGVDPQLSRESLSEAVKLINSTDDYDGGELQLEVTLMPDFRVLLTLPDSDLGTCFRRAAELDWLDALTRTEEFSSKRLQATAQVAICRAVL